MRKEKGKNKAKERKKRANRKYGQAKLKHSKKGIQSCVIAGIVLVALAAMIVIAYISAGTAAPYIGDILVNYVGIIGDRSACNNPGLYRCQE